MKLERRIVSLATYALLIAVAAVMMGPFIWMVSTSLKTFDQVFQSPPQLVPRTWHWSNFADAWRSAPFGRFFLNSILTAVAAVGLQLVFAVTAAYAFARLQFRGKQALFFLVLASMMIPIQVTFVPNFLIIRGLGWYNTYFSLIVPFSVNAFGIFMIRQAFMQVPAELEESAQLDGCSHLQIIRHIMVPLSAAPIVTFAFFSFTWTYNDLFWPLIATSRGHMRTVQVGLSSMIASEGGAGTRWNLIMAAAVFIIAPLLVLFSFLQKFIVKGISTTGLK
jgi:multiple sugar transport system permease protein/sn-glycerol 3-phosphate transport system permease protein